MTGTTGDWQIRRGGGKDVGAMVGYVYPRRANYLEAGVIIASRPYHKN
jgi:hypothetical protein